MPKESFQFQQFTIRQDRCSMKVGTDGVLLGAWTPVENARVILDVGAGTGLIALMMAQRAPKALIQAVELDRESALQAAENVAASPWADRVRVFQGDFQSFAKNTSLQCDLIVSNPPFFHGALKSPKADRNRVRHADTLPFGDLLRGVDHLLTPEGRLCLILPRSEGAAFRQMATAMGLYVTRIREVCGRPGKPVERVLMQLERTSKPLEKEAVLYVQSTPGVRSEAYLEMTREFYL